MGRDRPDSLLNLAIGKVLQILHLQGPSVRRPKDRLWTGFSERTNLDGIEKLINVNPWETPTEVERAEYLKRKAAKSKGREKEPSGPGWFGIVYDVPAAETDAPNADESTSPDTDI